MAFSLRERFFQNSNWGGSQVSEQGPSPELRKALESDPQLQAMLADIKANGTSAVQKYLADEDDCHTQYHSFFSKAFLQSEVFGEVLLLEGGSPERSFWRSWTEVFGEVFGLVLLGFSEPKNLQQKLQPGFMTRLYRGAPASSFYST